MVTVVGWGLNWPAMKVLLRELPPLFARGAFGVAAGAVFALVALLLRQSLAVPRRQQINPTPAVKADGFVIDARLPFVMGVAARNSGPSERAAGASVSGWRRSADRAACFDLAAPRSR